MNQEESLRQQIGEIVAIDTHTHLGSEWLEGSDSVAERVKKVLLGGYLPAYLASAGSNLSDIVAESTPEDMMSKLGPYLDSLSATGTYSATLEAFRDLYGFAGDFSNSADVRELIAGISAAYEGGERKRWAEVLPKAGVEVAFKNVEAPYFTKYLPSLLAEERDIEKALLRAVPRVDSFLYGPFDLKGGEMLELSMPGMTKAFQGTMDALDMRPESFEEYLAFIEAAFKLYKRHGAVAVKLTIGFLRELRFGDVPRQDAGKVFDTRAGVTGQEQARAFQDYVMRSILDMCGDYNLPIQIHTGLQSGNDSNMPDCNPVALTNLFREKRFKNVRFVLLHGGYPYTGETAVLAKSFPNVYLDFSWLTLLSPMLCARCLGEWLQLVPSSKLMHGSDAHTAENLYSVTVRIRRVLSDVLGEMMKNQGPSGEPAMWQAWMRR